MEPFRLVRNPYEGINAHLHSRWQNRGGWNSFHANHISDLARSLKTVLGPLGYDAETEYSLQIRRPADGGLARPRADVLLLDQAIWRPRPSPSPVGELTSTAVLDLPMSQILELDDAEEIYSAVAIYQMNDDDRGEPVAWVELLSPTNKPGGSDEREYRAKRRLLLQSGLVLVELDYLHQSPPAIPGVPVYYAPGRTDMPQPNAHAYHITIIDPRPELMRGQGHTHFINVDEPLPALMIPLAGADRVRFDFDPPYQRTLTELTYGRQMDYRSLPDHFESYSPADQTRIAARMLALAEAAQAGRDLESTTLTPVAGGLDALLELIAAWDKG
jgi:hypothetical protein